MNKPYTFGVIGYGYWGPNIVRNLTAIKETSVKTVCDLDDSVLEKVKDHYPHIQTTQDPRHIFNDKDIDVVAIITPVSTHYALAKAALEHGKHVFVEKPFTATVAEAEELIALAGEKGLQVMIDYTFLFTGSVIKMKEIIDRGDLGELMYIDSTRVSLGLFQHDVNVVWDLAPHDLAIIDYIVGSKPLHLTAHGVDHYGRGKENLAYVNIQYENNFLVHINVNWLSPIKVRAMLVCGNKKMLVWDDMEHDEKIKVYDKGVDINSRESRYKLLVDYRSGDMYSPRIDFTEALRKELMYFTECLNKNIKPFNDAESGLRVVRILEAIDASLNKDGQRIIIG